MSNDTQEHRDRESLIRLLESRPCRAEVAARVDTPGGGVQLGVEFDSLRWIRWLGAKKKIRRTYAFDAQGRAVYDACDGERTVRQIIEWFAEDQDIEPDRAAQAVYDFLTMLSDRGLIALAPPDADEEDDADEEVDADEKKGEAD